MEQQGDETTSELSALNRRNVLKGAVAVGVGAAVWTVPSITSLGGTPAYAANCTGGLIDYELSNRNTSCNCGPGDGIARYKAFAAPCIVGGPPFPGVVRIVDQKGTPGNYTYLDIDDNGATTGNSDGGCPAGSPTTGNAGLLITPTDPLLLCRIRIRITQNGACNGNTVYDQTTGVQGGTSYFIALPQIIKGSGGVPNNCSFNIRISLQCSLDEGCF